MQCFLFSPTFYYLWKEKSSHFVKSVNSFPLNSKERRHRIRRIPLLANQVWILYLFSVRLISLIHEEGESSNFREESASTHWHTYIAQPLQKWLLVVTDFNFQSPHFPLELLKWSSNSISNQQLDIRKVLIFHYASLIPAIIHHRYTYLIYLTPNFYVQFLLIFSFKRISLPTVNIYIQKDLNWLNYWANFCLVPPI